MYCMYSYLSPKRDRVKTVFPNTPYFLNDKIFDIRRKLHEAQSSITLITPDTKKIEDALKVLISEGAKGLNKEKSVETIMAELETCIAKSI